MTLTRKIARRLDREEPGTVFTRSDFLDLGATDAVGMALGRLVKAGKLRRIGRGLYDVPRSHPLLGELSPNAEAAAEAIALRDGGRIQPTGAAAANLLGLSEQVPARIAYQTDARSRKVQIGRQTIEFRRRSPRQMALAGRISALVVSALRSFGKGRVPEPRLARLHRDIPEKERRQLLKDLPLTPAWMHPHIRYIATGKSEP